MGPDIPGAGAFRVGPPSLPLRRLSSDHAPVGLPARRAAICPSLRRLAELCPQASSRCKNPSGCCLLQATSSDGRFEALVSLRQMGSDWRKWVQQGGPKSGSPGAAPVRVPLKPGKALGRVVRGKIVLRPKHAGAAAAAPHRQMRDVMAQRLSTRRPGAPLFSICAASTSTSGLRAHRAACCRRRRGRTFRRPSSTPSSRSSKARPSCRRSGASSRHTTTTRRRLSTLSLQPGTSRGACGSRHTSARSSAPRLGRTRWPRSGRTRRSTSRSATNSP
ncbi:hypothetical protein M885DRAFT_524127 [Pelagophyceae sp. CCMP2097]|nr:hypothetical protein M885DRAFT_524127 [Pelagophyceae sp. CCMP2097]